MKRVYVKEIAKILDEIDQSVHGFEVASEIKEKVAKIRAILLTY